MNCLDLAVTAAIVVLVSTRHRMCPVGVSCWVGLYGVGSWEARRAPLPKRLLLREEFELQR